MNSITLDKINIVLASDNNYAQHVAVLMASILANTSDKNRLCFYLLSDGIDEDKILKLEKTIAGTGVKLVVCDLSTYQGFEKLYTSGHISKAAYFRLDMANVLPGDVQKVIYIDVDLLVLRDIAELWNIDMQGKPIAAVPDYGIMSSKRLMKQKYTVIGLPTDKNYFNSGVVIMDLSQWREHDYSSKVINLAATGNFPHHDQDALNKLFMDNWLELPLSWNVIPPIFDLLPKVLFNSRFRENAIKARKNIAILHYAGRYKPWEFSIKTGFNDKYYTYLKNTTFADEPMPKPSKNMKGKSLTRQMIRIRLADFICSIFQYKKK